MKLRSRLLGDGSGTGAYGAVAQMLAERQRGHVDGVAPCCAAGTCNSGAAAKRGGTRG